MTVTTHNLSLRSNSTILCLSWSWSFFIEKFIKNYYILFYFCGVCKVVNCDEELLLLWVLKSSLSSYPLVPTIPSATETSLFVFKYKMLLFVGPLLFLTSHP
ncbi:hypothetical protein Lalb_Chr23g0267211 [Lupinus albus]|uniref:Uncharacterized protein n=1 Tax=Lupinus albus TaxID=3870 RepID=A0A6A4NHM6_LUPAL|nr:hypothetical protein Lalb_Chr23g0267211 [Lupinus albus]